MAADDRINGDSDNGDSGPGLVLQVAKACLHRGVGCAGGGKLVLCIGLDLAGLPLRVRRRRGVGHGSFGERSRGVLGGFRERDGRISYPLQRPAFVWRYTCRDC